MTGARPSRRRVLSVGTALLAAGPAMLSGCAGSSPAPERPDPLEGPARRAETDATLAQTVAQMAASQRADLATAASALATDRMTHARALRAELRRVRPELATSQAATPPAAPIPATLPADPSDLAGARASLIEAVRAAQDEAAALVVTLPGYRAALLASVSACCASHTAVLP